ncbi:4-hydroxybutyrate CoA-transferase [Clostridia bacterium]|nr:4-hydroxybutyrate CoA-transferase [Clostridia bacterium]
MNLYQREYEKRKCSLMDAYELVKDGSYLSTSSAAAEPIAFLKELHTIAPRIHKIRVSHSIEMLDYEFVINENYHSKFEVSSFFLMGPGRKAANIGRKDYMPTNLHDSARREIQNEVPDVYVCSVPPMDEMGFFRISLCNMVEREYIDKAKKVILEVVPDMPVLFGDNEIHISDVDAVFECNRPIPTIDSAPLGEEDRQIGIHVATLVEDGSTIQLGIGSIPDAIAQAFIGKKDLGIHTEMITNSVVDLVEKGVVTGKRKTLHRHKIVGTFALGNERLYRFLSHNPAIAIMPGRYVNDPYVIAQNDSMVSINTGLAVDLTGQVCSESLGHRQYSGTGGQSDTAIGAIHSKGGKSIIALHSTAKNGTISTITPYLAPGSIVSLSRNNIDYVVTEYGIAFLRSKTVSQRAQSLISIAHPQFRTELFEQAKKFGFIPDG